MPSSSSSRTSEASVKRGEGCVNFCSLVRLLSLSVSPLVRAGSSTPSSSLPRGMTARKPGNNMRSPLERHWTGPLSMVTVVSWKRAAAIWEATKRAQMSPVNLILVRGEVGLDVLGREGHVDGPDGFVGVLSVGLGLEIPLAAGGKVVLAETVFDEIRRRFLRFVRDAHGVGTHVGDEGGRAAIAELKAFIEALGDVHRAFGGIAEALVGGLLERGRDERRHGRAAAFLFFNGGNRERSAFHRLFERVGGFGVGDDRLLAFYFPKLGLERRRDAAFKDRLEQPVFFGHESLPFLFAFDDEAQGHGLDASGGDAPFDVFPEERGDLVSTRRSSTRRACWASNRLTLRSRG